MKKILFSAYSMDIGGIETSLLTLLNNLASKYDITLVLEKKQGIFLQELDEKIKVIEYTPCESKNIIIRKTLNLINRFKFSINHKNKYDFSACYATYSKPAGVVSRIVSKNNVLWVHADYMDYFNGNVEEYKSFFNSLKIDSYKNIIFVAQIAKENFDKIYPNYCTKSVFCNNIINYDKILKLSNENIDDVSFNKYTFVNVGRHDEKQKKLTRIIEAAKLLKQDEYDFQVLFIGEGKDTAMYKKMVMQYNLEDYIKILGPRKNPYSYIKNSNSVVLSSDYEGYPVVFLEALTLSKPIITTNVSDSKEDILGKYGLVVEKNQIEIYKAMREFVCNKNMFENKFDVEEYNKINLEKIEQIISKEK